MTLLRKYYDIELYGTGGGIPDESNQDAWKWLCKQEKYRVIDKDKGDCFTAYGVIRAMQMIEKELARLKEDNERLRGEGWISVEDRLPTLADCFSEKYAEVLTIQVGRERPTMMKYYELKHCPFTKFWMRVPQQNKPLY